MTDRPKLTLERTFHASIDDVWELWTTKEGIEAWWGPEGFSVAVSDLNLRPGGGIAYTMSAVAPEMIDYMKKAGMPSTTRHSLRFTEVDPPRRLAYMEKVDFVPGVETYEVETVVDLSEVPGGVHMLMTFEAMHDDRWTQLAVMGREGELKRLTDLLAKRRE